MGKEAGAASGFRLRQSYAARTCRAKEDPSEMVLTPLVE
jgi:hypothetical protein